jgi:signal transduction histidine kinase
MLANWSLRRRLTVLLLVLFVAFALSAVVAIATVRARNDAEAERTTRLDPARRAADAYLAAAIDQETGVRGFVITGDVPFLAPYVSGQVAADRAVARLRDIAERGDTAVALDRAQELLAEWREVAAEPMIDFVRSGDQIRAEQVERAGVARSAFGEFRDAAADLQREVEADLADANRRQDRLRDLLAAIAIGGFVVATIVIATLAFLLDRWVRRPLGNLAHAAERVASGRLDTPIVASGPPDIRRLARDVDAMRRKLLADLAGALRTNLLDVQQAERRRIAADLHDDPVQVLTVAVMRLDLLKGSIDDRDVATKLDEARNTVRDAIDRLRTMLFELHPPALDRQGLAAALDEYATDRFHGTGTAVDVDTTGDITRLSSGVRSLAFRVAREAITNAHKHAGASALRVRIAMALGGVNVQISDDGRGFAVQEQSNELHRGLEFGAELVRSAGGWWSIDSSPGRGTTVEFWLPDAVLVEPVILEPTPATAPA